MKKSALVTIGPRFATIDTRAVRPIPKITNPIYASPEYRAWREIVVEIGRCQKCGRLGKKPGRPGGCRLFADHIKELTDDGAPFDPANGQALCGACHTRKTAEARAERTRR